MTALEMKTLLLMKFEGLFEFSAPAYSNAYINLVLNNAQRRIIRDVDSLDPSRNYNGFDQNERIRKYLSPLLTQATVVPGALNSGYFNNSFRATLPSDCWYVKQERVVLTIGGNPKSAKVIPITLDFYNNNIDNVYKNPDNEFVWRIDVGTTAYTPLHDLITNGSAISSYKVIYMKKPTDISVITPTNCILHEDLHDDIVDEAYKIMTASINPELYNIINNEAKNN